jgi:hypothetical protein
VTTSTTFVAPREPAADSLVAATRTLLRRQDLDCCLRVIDLAAGIIQQLHDEDGPPLLSGGAECLLALEDAAASLRADGRPCPPVLLERLRCLPHPWWLPGVRDALAASCRVLAGPCTGGPSALVEFVEVRVRAALAALELTPHTHPAAEAAS